MIRNKEYWLDNPVFVLSIGKSGTTLLVSLFDGHSEVVVIPEETDYLDSVVTPLPIISGNPFQNIDKKINCVLDLLTSNTHLSLLNGQNREKSFAQGNIDYTKFDYNRFRKEIRSFLSANSLSVENTYKAIPYAYADVLGWEEGNPYKCWLEKTPYQKYNIENKVEVLETAFPNAKFIHLFRDPRDNFISFSKKNSKKWKVGRFAYEYYISVEILKKNIHKSNHTVLKYEDLVEFPRKSLEKLCDFIKIDFEPTLLKPTKFGNNWYGNSVENVKYRGLSKNSIGKHAEYDIPSKLAKVEQFLWTEMNLLNYEVSYARRRSKLRKFVIGFYSIRNRLNNLFFWVKSILKYSFVIKSRS